MPANRYRYPAGEGIPRQVCTEPPSKIKNSSDCYGQSERTASENKERAYIAASRRSDRSLEARVQSAFAASQIHKDRTGKALKVTEEIVLKEEMYEEEDDLPARYQALMNSPLFALNPRASAYAITQMGMRDVVAARFSNEDPSRLDEVNRQFAQVFPGFGMPLQQTPLCDARPVHSPTAPGSHPPFPQPTPTQATSPYSPVTQTQHTGFPHASPQNVAFGSPFGSPAQSRVDSPASAKPMMPANTMPSLNVPSPIQMRSMSMSHVDLHRETTISPVITPQGRQAAGQRRSYDEAFSSSQSPLMTPTGPVAFPSGTGIPSPGMPFPTGLPTTYNSNNNHHRASAQYVPMSPDGMHPMHAAGFTTQLPANVEDFFQAQNIDRSGSFSGPRQSFCLSPHSVPNTPNTQAQFQLQGNVHQRQREKKERRRRPTLDKLEAIKVEKAAEAKAKAKAKAKAMAKAKAKAKDALRPTLQRPVENARQEPMAAVIEQRRSKDEPSNNGFAVHARRNEEDVTPKPADTRSDSTSTTGSLIYGLEDVHFDLSNFQTFNTDDFNFDGFNMNFDDSFDINQFFTFPASQPESDNAQAVS